jgi:hypothetical protein
MECRQLEEVLPLRNIKVGKLVFNISFRKFRFHKIVKTWTTEQSGFGNKNIYFSHLPYNKKDHTLFLQRGGGLNQGARFLTRRILCKYSFCYIYEKSFPPKVFLCLAKLHRVKEKFVKGSVIPKIPSCERKVCERLCDSRNSIVWKKSSWKALW